MTTILVTCRDCHTNIELAPAQISILLADRHATEGTYGFNHCGKLQERFADTRVTACLIAVGVEAIYVNSDEVKRAVDLAVLRSHAVYHEDPTQLLEEFSSTMAGVRYLSDMWSDA